MSVNLKDLKGAPLTKDFKGTAFREKASIKKKYSFISPAVFKVGLLILIALLSFFIYLLFKV
ncbi:MAG: hypothetical protein DRP57_07190 [Spirochaetes bacterium]|nr:MAG: hypothetical protein DRP57_07190 [Spirochaetota bacterium]